MSICLLCGHRSPDGAATCVYCGHELAAPASRLPPRSVNVDTPRRRWSWTAFAVGLAVGIPLGAVGIIVLAQILTAMTALP